MKPPINLQDPDILKDAVSMLKSQFVELYVGLGHNDLEAGNAWHSLRVSKKGIELRNSLYKGAPHLQATTFIGDMNEEIKDKLKSRLNKKKTEAPKIQDIPELGIEQEVIEVKTDDLPPDGTPVAEILGESAAPEPETSKNEIDVATKKKGSSKPKAAAKPKKEAAPKKEKAPKAEKPAKEKKEGPARGELKQKVQAEIDKGIVDVAKIMETTGASKIYVNWILKQNKKK